MLLTLLIISASSLLNFEASASYHSLHGLASFGLGGGYSSEESHFSVPDVHYRAVRVPIYEVRIPQPKIVQYEEPQSHVVPSVSQSHHRSIRLRNEQQYDYSTRAFPLAHHRQQVHSRILRIGLTSGAANEGIRYPPTNPGIGHGKFDFSGHGSFVNFGGAFV